MTVLVTGVAGFIGYHTTQSLLDRGQAVIGIDDLNDYYDVSLKENAQHFTFAVCYFLNSLETTGHSLAPSTHRIRGRTISHIPR